MNEWMRKMRKKKEEKKKKWNEEYLSVACAAMVAENLSLIKKEELSGLGK